VILDEATSGLDADAARAVHRGARHDISANEPDW